MKVNVDQRAVVRRGIAAEKRDAMASGVRQRAATFRAKRGKGSYTRKTKHKGES
jgi:hypothetical protein